MTYPKYQTKEGKNWNPRNNLALRPGRFMETTKKKHQIKEICHPRWFQTFRGEEQGTSTTLKNEVDTVFSLAGNLGWRSLKIDWYLFILQQSFTNNIWIRTNKDDDWVKLKKR